MPNAFSQTPCPCGSAKPFGECHGAADPPLPPTASMLPWGVGPLGQIAASTSQAAVPGLDVDSPTSIRTSTSEVALFSPPQIARAPVTRKLDLAGGQKPREGFEGVDIFPGAQHVVNLQEYPWPFEDESVLELNCSHYVEHIPMENLTWPNWCGLHATDEVFAERYLGKDALFAFFDECYRILVPDGWLYIQVPCHRSDRAFQDPTHRRFITAQTFVYTNEQWRRDNALDHYNVTCNFIGGCDPIVDASMNLRHPQAAQSAMNGLWNTVLDWRARMQKKPRLSPK